ncbi:hypothetical protein L6452_22740 [Arctium lappa]|uniref:Uncharacterized protein n=1 Tax=Arctium lappa TaxID=4217 RepID=A0ACB9B102_ARCLA|nr:hypothetical protein L6452_22740 [Arctium lappa]
MENPRIKTDNQHLEKKRKNQENCLHQTIVMGSSKEQEILEKAAFHLILLSQQSSSDSKPYHHSDQSRLRMMKKKQDHAIQGIVTQNNDKDANSIATTFSSSSSIKSGISMEDQEHEVRTTTPRQRKPRFRSLVDIYTVTRPL